MRSCGICWHYDVPHASLNAGSNHSWFRVEPCSSSSYTQTGASFPEKSLEHVPALAGTIKHPHNKWDYIGEPGA